MAFVDSKNNHDNAKKISGKNKNTNKQNNNNNKKEPN